MMCNPGTPSCGAVRLGCRSQQEVDENSLTKLVSALVVNDTPLVMAVLQQGDGRGHRFNLNKACRTPWGGTSQFPLQAAVACSSEDEAMWVVARLLRNGADLSVAWRDCSGRHTPLSKALALRRWRLAGALVSWGADPTVALLETDLLSASRFDPGVVRWLLDQGACVASRGSSSSSMASHRSSGDGSSGEGSSRRDSSGSGSKPPASTLRQPSRPSSSSGGGSPDTGSGGSDSPTATQQVLRRLMAELHACRQFTLLHAAPGGGAGSPGYDRSLLQRAAEVFRLLLAAGAPPLDPEQAAAAEAACEDPADWAALQGVLLRPPEWSPATHGLFPAAFQQAARQVLLAAHCRGFAPPAAKEAAAAAAAAVAEEGQQQNARQRPGVCWLDMNVVLLIIKHLAPWAVPPAAEPS